MRIYYDEGGNGKYKEFADRTADINQQVQTGDVNFEQASGYALDCKGCGGLLMGLWWAEAGKLVISNLLS